jgi:hypothetical protein
MPAGYSPKGETARRNLLHMDKDLPLAAVQGEDACATATRGDHNSKETAT